MSLEMAKRRRLDALSKRSEDKVLVKPAHASQLNVPKEGTVAGYLVRALSIGCNIDALERETGWSRAQIMVNLYRLAKKTGFGLRRRADQFSLVLPDGVRPHRPGEKVVNPEETEVKVDPRRVIPVI